MNADWTNIPIGAGVAALLIREASRFLRERHEDDKRDSHDNHEEPSGERSVDFWEAKFREIVYSELERHVLPRLDDVKNRTGLIHDNVKELRWRKRNERTED